MHPDCSTSRIVGQASAFQYVLHDRQTAWDDVVSTQTNMARVIERDILRNLDIYDLMLRAAARNLRLVDASMDAEAQNAILFDGAGAAQYFRSVLVVDGSGRVTRDSGSAIPRVVSALDRPFFNAHRERPDLGLLVMLVTRSGLDGRPYLSMSRRITGPDDGFADEFRALSKTLGKSRSPRSLAWLPVTR